VETSQKVPQNPDIPEPQIAVGDTVRHKRSGRRGLVTNIDNAHSAVMVWEETDAEGSNTSRVPIGDLIVDNTEPFPPAPPAPDIPEPPVGTVILLHRCFDPETGADTWSVLADGIGTVAAAQRHAEERFAETLLGRDSRLVWRRHNGADVAGYLPDGDEPLYMARPAGQAGGA
jgi:hypothetical protein